MHAFIKYYINNETNQNDDIKTLDFDCGHNEKDSNKLLLNTLNIYENWIENNNKNNKNDLMKILNINYTKLLKHFHLIIGLNNNKNINKNKCTKNNKCQFLNRHTLRNNNNN